MCWCVKISQSLWKDLLNSGKVERRRGGIKWRGGFASEKKPCHLPKRPESAWFCAIWNGSRSVRVWCGCSALRGRLIHLFEAFLPALAPASLRWTRHLPPTYPPPPNHVPRRSFTPFSPLHRDTGSHPLRPVRGRVHSSAVKLCLLVLFLFFILFLTVDLSSDTGVVWLTANYFYLGFVFCFVFLNLLSVYTCLFLHFFFLSRWCLIFLFSKRISILEPFCQH